MKIELTASEVMWILDKVATEVARGKVLIDENNDEKDPGLSTLVEMAKEVVEALSKLGVKLTDAMSAEIEKRENEKKGAHDETNE